MNYGLIVLEFGDPDFEMWFYATSGERTNGGKGGWKTVVWWDWWPHWGTCIACIQRIQLTQFNSRFSLLSSMNHRIITQHIVNCWIFLWNDVDSQSIYSHCLQDSPHWCEHLKIYLWVHNSKLKRSNIWDIRIDGLDTKVGSMDGPSAAHRKSLQPAGCSAGGQKKGNTWQTIWMAIVIVWIKSFWVSGIVFCQHRGLEHTSIEAADCLLC